MSADVFDYIVIGAGSSGSIVAGELAADLGVRVLVLEHGDHSDQNPETLRASGYKDAFINDRVMWDRFSEPQRECANHRLYMGSGRGTGGSGSVNAMVYTRGSKFDYAQWETDGWRWDDLQSTFGRLESQLRISQRPATHFTETCIAAAERAGFRFSYDLNDGQLSGKLGYNWMNVDADNGDRRSAYVSFLRPREGQPNLRLLTGATVHRVRFDANRRATGVDYEKDGQLFSASARREIILSAGALETPKLLMLSGVGPGDELRRHAIPVVQELPAVGRNLMDHPNVQVFFASRERNDCTWAQLYGFHRANPDTPLPAGEADTCYVFYSAKSSFREGMIRLVPGMVLPPSLLQLGWPSSAIRGAIKGLFGVPGVKRAVEHIYGIVVILGKPLSRGSVRLHSSEPKAQALIDPNYFGDPRDLDSLVKGVQLARRVAATEPLARYGNLEFMPGAWMKSEEALRTFIRKNVMTTYHFSGTCALGAGADSAVTPELRLRGVTGLRIVDASVVPSVPVSAMNAPSMVVGLRGADLIREAWRERSDLAGTATV